ALHGAARATAACASLAAHWPGRGSRQDCFLALAGGLLRPGWAVERAERFAEALATATGDEEARKRVDAVGQTARKLEGGENVTGWPKLEELLGAQGRDVVRRAREWLGRPARAGGPAAPPPPRP